jgi:hypothetical protein
MVRRSNQLDISRYYREARSVRLLRAYRRGDLFAKRVALMDDWRLILRAVRGSGGAATTW